MIPAHGLDSGNVAEKSPPKSRSTDQVRHLKSPDRQFPASGRAARVAWRPYTGNNPHEKHFHISVKPGKTGPGGYDTTSDWSI